SSAMFSSWVASACAALAAFMCMETFSCSWARMFSTSLVLFMVRLILEPLRLVKSEMTSRMRPWPDDFGMINHCQAQDFRASCGQFYYMLCLLHQQFKFRLSFRSSMKRKAPN